MNIHRTPTAIRSMCRRDSKYAADSVINPLLQSTSWGDSALIFTYDEDGGYYDHVSPQPAAYPAMDTIGQPI